MKSIIALDINPDQAAAILYALEKHLHHCDELLGKNYEWPRERKIIEAMINRIGQALKNHQWPEYKAEKTSAKVIRIY